MHVGSVIITNVPLCGGVLVVGKVVYAWGQGECGKFLYLLLSFAINLNCSRRNSLILKGMEKTKFINDKIKISNISS